MTYREIDISQNAWVKRDIRYSQRNARTTAIEQIKIYIVTIKIFRYNPTVQWAASRCRSVFVAFFKFPRLFAFVRILCLNRIETWYLNPSSIARGFGFAAVSERSVKSYQSWIDSDQIYFQDGWNKCSLNKGVMFEKLTRWLLNLIYYASAAIKKFERWRNNFVINNVINVTSNRNLRLSRRCKSQIHTGMLPRV